MTKPLTLALAQTNMIVGDMAANATRMLRVAEEAAAKGADLVVFPEMSMVGYSPEDLVLVPAFCDTACDQLQQLARDTAHLPCALLVGNVHAEAGEIFNASFLLEAGVVKLLRKKQRLPNSGVFDEKRVFAEGDAPHIVHFRGKKLGVLICEEVWSDALPKHFVGAGLDALIVQNASPYHLGKAAERLKVVSRACEVIGAPVVYVNLVGGQDELVFDGRSYVLPRAGAEPLRAKAFVEDLLLVALENGGPRSLSDTAPAPMNHEETVYRALVLGLRDYVQKNKFPGVVIGLSGGIDSGLSAAIAVDALGASKVLGVRMPSPYTSEDSMVDAKAQADMLGIQLHTVPITPLMQCAEKSFADIFADRAADITEENIQARLRGLTLMAISNKFGHMVLTTGNKSEMSVGYATLYGDMCGGFSVLKDVYKTRVYALSAWRNRATAAQLQAAAWHGQAGEVIPARMLSKAPSAELRENQKDEDSLPLYSVLDEILRGLIERRLSVRELVAEGMDESTVARIARMVIGAEYKRRQSAPGVKITPMAFGRDRRFPITNGWKLG